MFVLNSETVNFEKNFYKTHISYRKSERESLKVKFLLASLPAAWSRTNVCCIVLFTIGDLLLGQAQNGCSWAPLLRLPVDYFMCLVYNPGHEFTMFWSVYSQGQKH